MSDKIVGIDRDGCLIYRDGDSLAEYNSGEPLTPEIQLSILELQACTRTGLVQLSRLLQERQHQADNCPKCGQPDIHVKHVVPGDSWRLEGAFTFAAKQPWKTEFLRFENGWIHVQKECLANTCRTCGFNWENTPVDSVEPEIKPEIKPNQSEQAFGADGSTCNFDYTKDGQPCVKFYNPGGDLAMQIVRRQDPAPAWVVSDCGGLSKRFIKQLVLSDVNRNWRLANIPQPSPGLNKRQLGGMAS